MLKKKKKTKQKHFAELANAYNIYIQCIVFLGMVDRASSITACRNHPAWYWKTPNPGIPLVAGWCTNSAADELEPDE